MGTAETVEDSLGIKVVGEMTSEYKKIVTPGALSFLEKLLRPFSNQREQLLQNRVERQAELDAGKKLNFLPETEAVRKGDWTIAPLPEDLQDRRVEITGPVERKMVINALNSGAKVFMADFEDANSPTWHNVVQGQINLRDAVNGTIRYVNPNGKTYTLGEQTATLLVRPRGWHLEEKNVLLDGKPISASIFDFAMYFYHNAKTLLEKGSGPYFYLPKLESHREARLWNQIFELAQQELGIPQGTIKATVLIETITAAFEMDEILYELREHSAGLNCGRWDYIFSYLKKFRNDPAVILPDRSEVTMTSPFMRAYSLQCIKTCHRRNAPAIGGMAAQIPVKNNPEANEQAFQKVREDKEREAKDGHDGTWVAHPALVPVAMEVFDRIMPQANQINMKREDVQVTAEDLLEVPQGSITEQGLRTNIRVGILYLSAWLAGSGAVPIDHLMEDAATAEISRAQIWQWVRHEKGVLMDGRDVTLELFHHLKQEELEKIKGEVGEEAFASGSYEQAAELFTQLIRQNRFEEFLTIPAYQRL